MGRTSLDQWAALAAVVDAGGFAQAADALHKSQSAISYSVARLQEALAVNVLSIKGRRAVLTPHGSTLLKRARPVLRDIETLEALARSLQQGWEPTLRLLVDVAFPRDQLIKILGELQHQCPNTEMQVSDAVLSGAEEAIVDHAADVVVTTRLPPAFLGELLMTVRFTAVANPTHALFQLNRTIVAHDLVRHVQVVVRDSGSRQPRDEGWLGAERRYTVNSLEASLATIEAGLGFGWLPEHLTAAGIGDGSLRPLPLNFGGSRFVPLHLVLVRPEIAGPAARAAVDIFRRHRPHDPGESRPPADR